MKSILFLFIVYLFFVTCISKIVLEDDTSKLILAKFAYKTYSIFCDSGKTTLIIQYEKNEVCNYFFKYAGKLGNTMGVYSYILTKNVSSQETIDTGRADLTIIFIRSVIFATLKRGFDIIEKNPLYSTFSKYLIVVSKSPENGTSWIENIFKFLWTKKILRVFIAFWDDKLNVYRYSPFLDEYTNITDANDKEMTDYLEFELFSLNGYPLRVFLFDGWSYTERVEDKTTGDIEYVGYDGKPLTQVRNVLNVTLKIIRESNQNVMKKYSNVSRTKIYVNIAKLFKEHDIDILFTAIRAQSYDNVDHIFLHERDDVVIIVPKGEKIPEYLYIFKLLPSKFIFATVFFMILISFVLHFIRRNKHFKKDNYLLSLFDAYKMTFCVPLSIYNNSFQERIILFCWMWFGVMFSCAFNSTLVSTLVVPKYYKDLNKIEDLVKTNLTVWTTKFEYNLLQDTLKEDDAKLLKNIRIVDLDANFTNKIYYFQNESGFLMRHERAREFMKVTKKIGRVR